MKTPVVSVIMSVFNGQEYLSKSIESILEQTFEDFEFIILNDGSTDDSLGIINKYAKKDDRIIVINNEKNMGLTKSLNKCIKLARGEYIARQDADDISEKIRLETILQFLESVKNKEKFILTTMTRFFDNENNYEAFYPPYNRKSKKLRLLFVNQFSHGTFFFPKTEEAYYDDDYAVAQDYELLLRLIHKKKYVHYYLDIPLYNNRIHKDRISKNRDKQLYYCLKAQYKNLSKLNLFRLTLNIIIRYYLRYRVLRK